MPSGFAVTVAFLLYAKPEISIHLSAFEAWYGVSGGSCWLVLMLHHFPGKIKQASRVGSPAYPH